MTKPTSKSNDPTALLHSIKSLSEEVKTRKENPTNDKNKEKKQPRIPPSNKTSHIMKKPTTKSNDPAAAATAAASLRLKKRLSEEVMTRKENPRIIRLSSSSSKSSKERSIWIDLFLFLGVITVMLVISFVSFDGIVAPTAKNNSRRESRKGKMKRQQEALYKHLTDIKLNEDGRGGDDDLFCDLYLAESSIPGSSGYGVFSGRRFDVGDELSESGIALPVTIGSPFNTNATVLRSLRRHHDLHENNPAIKNGGAIIAPHLSLLLKSFSHMSNVNGGDVSCNDDNVAAESAGSITTTTTCLTSPFRASRSILPGEELFLNSVVREDDVISKFPIVDDIVRDQMKLVTKKNTGILIMKKKKDKGISSSVIQLLKKTVARFDPLAASLLPSSVETLRRYSRDGCTYGCLTNRTLSWLKRNGRCIDNIQPGTSTISNAGQGAFAKRDIPKGSLITPATLFMTRDDDNNDSVLANYCFGHEESTIRLCQMTLSALINHAEKATVPNDDASSSSSSSSSSDDGVCSNDECSSDGGGGIVVSANAEYEWSSWNVFNNNTLHLSIDELREKEHIEGLSFDIIATRDIRAGDEIFLDYGDEWQRSWDEYYANRSSQFFRQSIGIRDDIFPKQWKNKLNQ